MASLLNTPKREISQGIGDLSTPQQRQILVDVVANVQSRVGLPVMFSQVRTTDNTVTTLQTITLQDTTSYLVEAYVLGKRVSGSSGTAGDSAGYIRRAVYFRSGGGATLVGSVQDGFTAESQAAWDCTLSTSGNTVTLTVLGATNNNVEWSGLVTIQQK